MDVRQSSDFLLHSEAAQRLFHDYAADCPIADYHNHLSAEDLYNHRRFRNLTELWLETDHYKWRAMRACGVDEKYITGDAAPYEKFTAWTETLPQLIGNPLYHWAHMELSRYFDINEPLTPENAEGIWDKTELLLQQKGYDAVSLLQKMKVSVLCTTDEPGDTLQWHRKIRQDSEIPFAVRPSFRPDKILLPNQQENWHNALHKLEERYAVTVDTYKALCNVLRMALDDFAALGCKLSDHGITCFVYATGDPAPLFDKAYRGERLSERESAVFFGELLRFLAKEYHARGMAMQLHLGAMRNVSPRIMKLLGPDSGVDSVGGLTDCEALASFLGDLESEDCLPQTVLYNLNSGDNLMLATMAGDFAPTVQFGAAWWFNDTLFGMKEQIRNLMETGQLSHSVGMLTDSRSFTSFVRHEYYRRILCNQIGELVEKGEYPENIPYLGSLVKRICFDNAKEFFAL